MFPICPRVSDDYDDFWPLEQWTRPLVDTRSWGPLVLPSRTDASQLWNQLAALSESKVQNTDKEFRATVYLPNFSPEEIKITSNDKQITITAKHEEKKDKHGYVKREVTRCFTLPGDVDPKTVTSSMTSKGVLNVRADKKAIQEAPKDTVIPVEYKG